MATPFSSVHLGAVGSTQDEAIDRFDGYPLLVTARSQSEGRGRSGHTWENADRALAASLAFDPGWSVEQAPLLALVSGLAAREALGAKFALKWPNDVLLDGRKVAGLLAESVAGVVILGFGVNLFWPDPIDGAGAVFDDDPGGQAGPALAESWAAAVLRRTKSGPGRWGRAEYAAACVTLGRAITWEPDGEGTATGIAADGGLEVDTTRGAVILRSGAVTTVRET